MRCNALIFAGALASAATIARAAPQPATLTPSRHGPAFLAIHDPVNHAAIAAALAGGRVQTLPHWSNSFVVENKTYHYTLLGTDPAKGPATTIVPTVLVPIRLTVPDYLVKDVPLVLDATRSMPSVIASPIFTAARFDTGHLQFTDAMLHGEFTGAPKGWHLLFSPSVAPTLDILAKPGTVQVLRAKSGQYLGNILDDHQLNAAINASLAQFSPESYVVYFTYNALPGYFGYHDDYVNKAGTGVTIYTYTSWLVGVDDLFSLPSPDADTLAHEIAESTHDAFGTSLTRDWGDWFGNNVCFQPYIEVGDAVEDAPAAVQNYREKVQIGTHSKVYTLQTEAMLPWFERQYPSTAIHGAYTFPGETAILGPAPFNCTPPK